MSPVLKNLLMLAVVVVILGGAAFFFFRGDKEGKYTGDPSTKTGWMCEKCGKVLQLTDKQVNEWLISPDKVRRDDAQGKQIVFWCPDCKAFTITRAGYCAQHNTWFVEVDTKGVQHNCPQCLKEHGE